MRLKTTASNISEDLISRQNKHKNYNNYLRKTLCFLYVDISRNIPFFHDILRLYILFSDLTYIDKNYFSQTILGKLFLADKKTGQNQQ